MLSRLQEYRNKKEEGFTLIELLVVILIIGILAAIAIPAFMNQKKSAIDATLETDLANAAIAVETWKTSHSFISGPGLPEATYTREGLSDFAFINIAKAVAAATGQGDDDPYKIVTSKGNTLSIKSLGLDGQYCIYGTNPNGDRAATEGLFWDSKEGGLNRGGACNSVDQGDVDEQLPDESGEADVDLTECKDQCIEDIDKTTGDEIFVHWQDIEQYNPQREAKTLIRELVVTRKSDGQKLNGRLIHVNGTPGEWGGSSYPATTVTDGVTVRDFSKGIDTDTGEWTNPIPVNGVMFWSHEAVDKKGALPASTDSADIEIAVGQVNWGNTSLPATIPVTFTSYTAGGDKMLVPTVVSGTMDTKSFAGQKRVKITAMDREGTELWEAEAYPDTASSGVTKFETSTIESMRRSEYPASKFKISGILHANANYMMPDPPYTGKK